MKLRIEQLMQKIPDQQTALLITSGVNRRYFTGLQSTAGSLLVTKDAAYFIIDFRYIEMARQCVLGCEVILQTKLYEQLTTLFTKHGIVKLQVETGYMTLSEFDQLQKQLPDITVLADAQLNDEIIKMRTLKSKEELSDIQSAQKITDSAFEELLNFIKPGITELQLANQLRSLLYQYGAQGEAFDIIVASGMNSAKPHAHPTDKTIERGDFVTMDFGASYNGYCSDMTRTVGIGLLDEAQVKLYNTVLDAQNAAFAAIKAGVDCFTVDKAARDLIETAGYHNCFGHGLGHSLGLEIHEKPCFNTVDYTICEEGMVLSVEPGIYLEGQYGCRIEDIVYITNDGFLNLTHSPKNLILI